jgi:hypothetical protein
LPRILSEIVNWEQKNSNREQNVKGKVRILKTQKNKYISERRMSLLKPLGFDFLVWEKINPFLIVEVCVTSAGGLKAVYLPKGV